MSTKWDARSYELLKSFQSCAIEVRRILQYVAKPVHQYLIGSWYF